MSTPDPEDQPETSAAFAGAAVSADRIKADAATAKRTLSKIIVTNNEDMVRRREIERCLSQIDESADIIRAANPPNSPDSQNSQ